jgi:hypothetical protein
MFHITFLDTMLTLKKQYSISDFKVEYLRDLMVNWADATNWMSFDLTLLPDLGNSGTNTTSITLLALPGIGTPRDMQCRSCLDIAIGSLFDPIFLCISYRCN